MSLVRFVRLVRTFRYRLSSPSSGVTLFGAERTVRGHRLRRQSFNWGLERYELVALDVEGGTVYWSQKGNGGDGRIFRANMEIAKGQTATDRKDIELLFDGLPEPIDIDLDLSRRTMYWSDRGDPPRGNTVNRAPMDMPKGADPKHRTDQEILVRGLKEGIGIALDLRGGHTYYTDLAATSIAQIWMVRTIRQS
jgi:hypothetical protein